MQLPSRLGPLPTTVLKVLGSLWSCRPHNGKVSFLLSCFLEFFIFGVWPLSLPQLSCCDAYKRFSAEMFVHKVWFLIHRMPAGKWICQGWQKTLQNGDASTGLLQNSNWFFFLLRLSVVFYCQSLYLTKDVWNKCLTKEWGFFSRSRFLSSRSLMLK